MFQNKVSKKMYRVIKKMKNGKSPGPGNINLELIKYGGRKALTMVTRLINKILQGGSIPQEIKTGYLIQIHKRGDKRKCGNYRGISIMNPFMKILGNLIKNWIENHYKGNEEQSSFTKGRSTVDHIFTIRQILEKCNMQQEDISFIFYDLEKAYDSVPRKLLWQALEKANESQSVIQIIRNIYSNNKCRIKIRSNLSDEFCNIKGLLKGCPMSPTLFKIYIDTALKEWSRKCKRMGLQIGDNCYAHNLLFADDQEVITGGVEDANYIGRKLEEEYEKWGLKMNYGKTEYLGTDHTEDLQVNLNIIPTVKQFKYLGSTVQDNGSSDLEIEKKD
jgi:hypothetical protein